MFIYLLIFFTGSWCICWLISANYQRLLGVDSSSSTAGLVKEDCCASAEWLEESDITTYPTIGTCEDLSAKGQKCSKENTSLFGNLLKRPESVGSRQACQDVEYCHHSNDSMMLAMMFDEYGINEQDNCLQQRGEKVDFLTNLDGSHSLPCKWNDELIFIDGEPDDEEEELLLYANDNLMCQREQQHLTCQCHNSANRKSLERQPLIIELPEELCNFHDDDHEDEFEVTPSSWPIMELHENPLNYLPDEQVLASGEQFVNEFMSAENVKANASESHNCKDQQQRQIIEPQEGEEEIGEVSHLNQSDEQSAKTNYSDQLLKRSRILSLCESNKDKRAAIKLVSSTKFERPKLA